MILHRIDHQSFANKCRDLTRFASLWLDVSDCDVPFGVPADWEVRWGDAHGGSESEPTLGLEQVRTTV